MIQITSNGAACVAWAVEPDFEKLRHCMNYIVTRQVTTGNEEYILQILTSDYNCQLLSSLRQTESEIEEHQPTEGQKNVEMKRRLSSPVDEQTVGVNSNGPYKSIHDYF